MTSQHFDDGWNNCEGDWGNFLENTNPQQVPPQPNQQYVQPQPPQLTSNAPIYSPFSYQQPQASAISTTHQTQPNPFVKSAANSTAQNINNNSNNNNNSQLHQQYANPLNFFNTNSYNEGNRSNNNNVNQYATSQQPPTTFSYVQSPTSTATSSFTQPINPQFERASSYQYQDTSRNSSMNINQNQNPVQYVAPSVPQSSNLPPPVNTNFLIDQNSSHLTPLLPTQQSAYNNNNLQQNTSQPRNVATPPTLHSFDTNSNSSATQLQSTYQYSQQWNDQRSQSNESANNASNWHQQSVQQQPLITSQTTYNANQQMPVVSMNSLEWQNVQPQAANQPSIDTSASQPSQLGGAAFFQSTIKEEMSNNTIQVPESSQGGISTNLNQIYQPQMPKFDVIENIQTPIIETPLPIPQPQTSNHSFSSLPPKNLNENVYPENRERLDDLVVPSMVPQVPSVPLATSSAPSIDRHNYLVTGQLSQEFPAFNGNQLEQHENLLEDSFNESHIPPGLSRMVVGEPEYNQQQLQHDLLPPRSNRMVTGNEMTPTSFLNYRQADGQVSHESSIQRPLPAFSNANHQPQREEDEVQPSLNISDISDRNLYLVAGESDVNSQRVITGVESNQPINIIMNPLQNLHIEDDEDFVNISVTQMSRNVDGDGMEEEMQPINSIQHSIDSSQQREEEIEGANDNNAELANNNAIQPVNLIEIPQVSLNDQNSQNNIREDIEGGNDSSDSPPIKSQSIELNEEKRKSIDSGMKSQPKQNITLSSEDSELRELEKNMKSKSRRSKKYDSNDSESASLDEYKGKSKERYDDRSSKKNRDRVRDEYERYKKKEKERRSGGRSRRNDDTDGSKYGDSRRRTDDEEDDKRRNRNINRDRRNEDNNNGADNTEPDRKGRNNRDHRDAKRKDYEYDERRRERRRREKQYEEEGYPSGRRSHNTSDREYDRDYRPGRSSRGAYEMQGYYQQPAYPYDHNYYYQQQYSDKLNNWLEQIRLTNPQAYEWYKSYYSGILQKSQMPPQPPMDDIGGSLISGYNSSSERASTSRFISGGIVNNPLRSLNTSFIDNTNEYQSLQPSFQAIGKDFNQAYSSLNYNTYDSYGDSRIKTTEVVASRMTPQKFQCLHGFVRLMNGLMISIDTSNADDKYSVKIENISIMDKTRKLYQSYPGPLIRGVSHKKTVIEFCEEKLKQNTQLESSLRSSYALLWSYLILMIRQNGSYTEHDIAELLMKNSEEYRSCDFDDNKSSSNNQNINEDENATDVSESEENVLSEHNSVNQSNQVTQSSTTSILTEQFVLDKFKNYLLYGNIHDALEYATDNNLWGHALFLASKVDRRQHANVMLKFANKLSYNDPLQTLYQIMSGRMPACATNFDEKWGDWRPHLAMIISNCTDKPDLVKRTVSTLGDLLASRGDIYGSQFCYLLIDPQFTDFSDTSMSNGKIALLGTTNQKPFNEFASNDSIIMTEIFEYARSLNSENYFITKLQKYKFLLATNMLDYGLKLKCLLYMEQISKCIIQQPESFDSNFISKIYSFADRLKYYDPVMEKLYEDNTNNTEMTEDQKWLQDLALVLQKQDGFSAIQQNDLSYAPAYDAPAYVTNDVYNPMDYQQQIQPSPIHDPMSQNQTPIHASTVETSQTYEEHDSRQYENFEQQQNQVPISTYDQNTAYNQQYPQEDQQQTQNYQYGQNFSMQNDSQHILPNKDHQSSQQPSYMQPNFDPNAQYQQTDYNFYGSDQPKPNITMGATTSQNQNENAIPKKPEADVNKKVEKKNAKSTTWLSSLFRLGKAPNQMILPEDKDPTIVWDEATKKWVNKDQDPLEAESFKPPPKMGEMGGAMPQQQLMQNIQQVQTMQNIQPMQAMSQQSAQQPPFVVQNQQPSMSQQPIMSQQPMMSQSSLQNQNAPILTQMNPIATEEAANVSSAPNMFKMQKGRNLKKSYVDILGNAGKTVSQPKELVPQMDMQFFNPTAQPQGMQFYNPNDF